MTALANPNLALSKTLTNDAKVIEERARFCEILKLHAKSEGMLRRKTRDVLVQYVTHSQQSEKLITDLILSCLGMTGPDRLDIAIDILAEAGPAVHRYATRFWMDDFYRWGQLHHNEEYQPNVDYWYILLVSVAQSNIPANSKLAFIRNVQWQGDPRMAEAIVTALETVGTAEAVANLHMLTLHGTPYIASLAAATLSD